MKRPYENIGGQGNRRPHQDDGGRGRGGRRYGDNRGGRDAGRRSYPEDYYGNQRGHYGPTGSGDQYPSYRGGGDPYYQNTYGSRYVQRGSEHDRYYGGDAGSMGHPPDGNAGSGRSRGGRGRGRDFGGRSRALGRGRSGGGRGGRGRGGRGRESLPDMTGLAAILTNIVPANVTEAFQFFFYSVDCRDAALVPIESRHRRRFLFNLGLWDGLLKDLPEKEKDDLRKVVFFSGAYFFSARQIPGVDPSKLPLELPLDDKAEGELIRLVKFEHYTAPKELTTAIDFTETENEVKVDQRCADCTRSFLDIGSLLQHCQKAGHSPVFLADQSRDQTNVKPAQLPVFIAYSNMVLGRALGEKLARWGNEFIDPSNMTEPTDKRGDSLGVRVYQAYSCSFGFLRNQDGTAGLALTVDLRAKVVRVSSVLDHLCGNRDPARYNPTQNEQSDAKGHWIGEVVISLHDKKCYAVTDLKFEHSAASMPVDGLGMSHAEYFEKRKDIKLNHPHAAPMIAVLGRRNNTIHLPPELVAGNELEKRVKEQLPMIASFTADQKNAAIDKIRAYLDPRKKSSSVGLGLLPALGIQLKDERLSAKAKIMPIPRMIAAGIEIPRHRGSNWASALNKANFNVNPGEANDLQVILVANDEIKGPERIFEKLRNHVNSLNSTFRFSQQPMEVISAGHEGQHWGPIEKALSTRSGDSNIFVLDFNKPRGSADPAYHVVKKMLAQFGFLSQFVNFRTHPHDEVRDDDKRSNIIMQGVARQIIQKTGTRLWWVHVPRSLPTPSVFIGVDVFHAPRVYDPKLKRKIAPGSCAAIVVQICRGGESPADSQIELFTKTFAREPGKEYDLGGPLQETLQVALEELDVSPKSCIVWRDGIGDQSFESHAQDEIKGIRKGLRGKTTVGASIPEDDIPLSYIVCQKRIDTKLFTKDIHGHQNGKFGAPAGTLVNSIQGLRFETFYINGTAPPYSTAKPVRYVVVEQDNGIAPVPLDELTWELCHDYANWPGPIKVPSVVQMAHKLAELGGGFSDCGTSIDARKFKNRIHFL